MTDEIEITITNPAMLPGTIKRDIYMMLEYEDVDAEIIMEMIEKRCKAKIVFTIKDLKKYLKLLKKKVEKLPIPITQAEVMIPSNNSVDTNLDNSPLVDYKNKAAVLDMFWQTIVERFSVLKRVTSNNAGRNEVIGELEVLILQYIKVSTEFMEKEDKLRTTVQESSKYNIYIKEKMDIILMVVKGALKKTLSSRKYKEVTKEIQEALKLYQF